VQELELAAEARYREGLELMARGRHGAGIYLLGYVVEMRLKLACFRLMGASNTTPVDALREAARRNAKHMGVAAKDESCHSLRFWFELVEQHRARSGRPSLAADYTRCVERVYRTWWVEMRYHPDLATDRDMDQVHKDVSWLDSNYLALWT
jgi:hypothetical protein